MAGGVGLFDAPTALLFDYCTAGGAAHNQWIGEILNPRYPNKLIKICARRSVFTTKLTVPNFFWLLRAKKFETINLWKTRPFFHA